MHPLESERPLIVYMDFKSPYAYLALQPTRDMAKALGIAIDWRPFVLDIPSYLGSAKLDRRGKVASANRSSEQWSGVKYAYFDCRRYANLRGLTVRGTTKIWDTSLAAIGMLWARDQGEEVLAAYMDRIYEPFWKRELDLEDQAVIREQLQAAGAKVAGFDEYCRGEGAAINSALQEAAFDAGVFGVPTYICDGERFFGREHLPRIRWILEGRQGQSPGIANEAGAGPLEATPVERLAACIDFHCPWSYLALEPILSLAADFDLHLDWHPRCRQQRPLDPDDTSRSGRHKLFRRRYHEQTTTLYAGHPLPGGGPQGDNRLPAMALLWLQATAPEQVTAFLRACYKGIWRKHKVLAEAADLVALMHQSGLPTEGLELYFNDDGPEQLEASIAASSARGCWDTPTLFLGDEPFLGQQHLPLIRRLL